MSLYSYFAKASKRSELPDPSGALSAQKYGANGRDFSRDVTDDCSITSHHCHSKRIERVASLSLARKLLANNGSPDVFVDMVTSHHRFH